VRRLCHYTFPVITRRDQRSLRSNLQNSMV